MFYWRKNMNYSFFDYKYNIKNFTSDFFGISHIIFIVLSFILVPILCIIFRKINHKKIDLFLKVYSILITILEFSKIIWESYYDISTGQGFNIGGILPFYTCSLFMYSMLLVAWTKGRAKEYALSFLTTIGLLSGAIAIVYLNALNYYPFWTFGAFSSIIVHFSMFDVHKRKSIIFATLYCLMK